MTDIQSIGGIAFPGQTVSYEYFNTKKKIFNRGHTKFADFKKIHVINLSTANLANLDCVYFMILRHNSSNNVCISYTDFSDFKEIQVSIIIPGSIT